MMSALLQHRLLSPARAFAPMASLSLLALAIAACTEQRVRELPAPVYRGDIEPLLAEHCGRCHGDDASAGYRVDGYLHVLGCTATAPSTPAVRDRDAGAALLAVLERDDHADLLSRAEQARLRSWIEHGTPIAPTRVHDPSILDPRSKAWHGRLAAQDRYAALRDAQDPRACGRCHDGAPVRPRTVRVAADGAPACTECHTASAGVLACGTCHGDGFDRAAPPRDGCLFVAPANDAHRAHLESTRLRAQPLSCATCHPGADATLTGTHANGHVDVQLDPSVAGEDARFFEDRGTCAVSCHDLGGARTRPSFREAGPLTCGDCHGVPPEHHFAGDCSDCHLDTNRNGSALRSTELHMNGRIDVAAGDGDCGFCHGRDGDPMPRSPSHLLHRDTQLTTAIVCTDCHVVPERITSEGHLDRDQASPADVVFGARASAFAQTPSYEAGTCRQIACHGAGLPDEIERALRWDDPSAGRCSGCHGLPPGQDHPQEDSCASTLCHGVEIGVGTGTPRISEAGRAFHIDGRVDHGSP